MADTAPRLSVDPAEGGLRLAGEIDAHTAPTLADALRGLIGQTSEIELDMAEVTFIDSSGLRVIVESLNQARATDGSLVIRRPSRAVARLLELSGLDDLLAKDTDGAVAPE